MNGSEGSGEVNFVINSVGRRIEGEEARISGAKRF